MGDAARWARLAYGLAGLSIASPTWPADEAGVGEPAAPPQPAAAAPVDATPSSETPPGPLGISLSVRAGFAIPRGDAFATTSGATKLNSEFASRLSFRGDFGVLLWRRLVIGGYLAVAGSWPREHGSGPAGQMCQAPGVDRCMTEPGFQAGVQALAKLMVDQAVEPWVGLGTGYEYVSYTSVTSTGREIKTHSYAGWDLLSVQAGADWRLFQIFKVGPYASVSIGRYDRIDVPGVTIERHAIHEWVELGVRGTFEGSFR